jgi:hypothetical protein
MTLLFGNFTVKFVDFSIAAARASQGGASPEAAAALAQAADDFRKIVALDALYLVCIGRLNSSCAACHDLTIYCSQVLAYSLLHTFTWSLGSERRK